LVHTVAGFESRSAVPAAQLSHDVDPVAEYVPASQSVHDVDPASEYVPASQAIHCPVFVSTPALHEGPSPVNLNPSLQESVQLEP
jgi:hypothetical protein